MRTIDVTFTAWDRLKVLFGWRLRVEVERERIIYGLRRRQPPEKEPSS